MAPTDTSADASASAAVSTHEKLNEALDAGGDDCRLALPGSWCWHARWEFPAMPHEELEEALSLRIEQTFGNEAESMNWAHRAEKVGESEQAKTLPNQPGDEGSSSPEPEPDPRWSVSVWVVTPAGQAALSALEARDQLPVRVFPWPEWLAATFTSETGDRAGEMEGATRLVVSREQSEDLLLVVCAKGRCLQTAQIGMDEPSAWRRVFLEWELAGWRPEEWKISVQEELADWFSETMSSMAWEGEPVVPDIFSEIRPSGTPPEWADLTPGSWTQRVIQRKKSARLRKRLITGVAVYAVVLGLLGVWALWSQHRAKTLTQRASTLGPALEEVARLSSNWSQFDPLFMVERHPVDLLRQIAAGASQERGFKLTRYLQQGQEITMEGETPDVALFYEFVDALKASPGLEGAAIEPGEPISGADGRWNFRVFASWKPPGAAS